MRPTAFLPLAPSLALLLPFAVIVARSAGADTPAPAKGAKHLVISDFGAVPDGKTLNTAAIQKAIDQAAAAAGGGVVEIPAGTFLSGSIFLKTGVELYLASGAVLRGSNQIEDYPKRETRIEGHFEPWRMALVNAQQMDHVRITGQGILDGNGPTYWAAFWQRRKENPRCTNLEVERPRLMFIDRCNDVRIEGVALQDSGFWNLHVYHSRDVVIENIRITIPSAVNGLRGPSTDGIDVDSCQKVTIRKCYISCNDDNIALKGSKGPHADKDADSPPVEDIVIEDSEFGDGNGVVTCGSEATVVRNVTVRNCVLSGRTSLLTLKLRPDTPQRYENIVIDGIKVNGGGRILNVAPWTQFFDLQGEAPPSSLVTGVTIRNVTGNCRSMGSLGGHKNSTIRNITLENIQLTLTDEHFALGQVENLQLKNVQVNGKDFVLPAPTTAKQ
jgi:polygalacturonase